MIKRGSVAPMPPRAAAYLEVVAVRERIFTMMFDRTGTVKKAVEDAYVAMAFIEEGDASGAEGGAERHDTTDPALTPPGGAGADEPVSDTRPTPVGQNAESHGADGDTIAIGHKNYTRAQLERFKTLWASPTSTIDDLCQCLGVTWLTAQKVADRIGLGSRSKKRGSNGSASANVAAGDAITLDQAIDWFEAHEGGRPVIPSDRYPGSYELGEDTGAIVTRNALVAEINALRLRNDLQAFTIQLNGA